MEPRKGDGALFVGERKKFPYFEWRRVMTAAEHPKFQRAPPAMPDG